MGADRVVKGRYQCAHGCFYGHCDGHDFEVWYREGTYYIKQGEGDYRQGVAIDRNLLDDIVEAMSAGETKRGL